MKRIEAFGKIVMGILREIGDQNAYQRYLERNRIAHSGEAWRRFHEHRLRCKYEKPKCC